MKAESGALWGRGRGGRGEGITKTLLTCNVSRAPLIRPTATFSPASTRDLQTTSIAGEKGSK